MKERVVFAIGERIYEFDPDAARLRLLPATEAECVLRPVDESGRWVDALRMEQAKRKAAELSGLAAMLGRMPNRHDRRAEEAKRRHGRRAR